MKDLNKKKHCDGVKVFYMAGPKLGAQSDIIQGSMFLRDSQFTYVGPNFYSLKKPSSLEISIYCM